MRPRVQAVDDIGDPVVAAERLLDEAGVTGVERDERRLRRLDAFAQERKDEREELVVALVQRCFVEVAVVPVCRPGSRSRECVHVASAAPGPATWSKPGAEVPFPRPVSGKPCATRTFRSHLLAVPGSGRAEAPAAARHYAACRGQPAVIEPYSPC